MKIPILLVALTALSFVGIHAQARLEYNTLTPKQRVLIDKWAETSEQAAKTAGTASQKFASLTASQISTFAAISNALSNSRLTDASGRTIGHSIDLVSGIETIAGEEAGKGSDEQYRWYVKLTPDSVKILEASKEFSRGKNNTVFHHGYPINYRQDGKVPNLQFSITKELDRADIDVDYRSSGFPAALFNGHLTAANSDVRAKGNYPTHLDRWIGLVRWWEDDVGALFSEIFGGTPRMIQRAEIAHETNAADTAKVAAATEEFFKTWLVKRDANQAMKFTSANLAACVDTKQSGPELQLRVRRRVLLAETLQAVVRRTGKVTAVSEAIKPIAIHDRSLVPVEHRSTDSYTLAHAPDSYYRHFVCDTAGIETPMSVAIDRSGKYGKYYVTAFRLDLKKGEGGGLKFIWTFEGDQVRLVTFDVITA